MDLHNTLVSLAKSEPVPTHPYCYFTDQRIVANGFAIREYKGKMLWYVFCSLHCCGDDVDDGGACGAATGDNIMQYIDSVRSLADVVFV